MTGGGKGASGSVGQAGSLPTTGALRVVAAGGDTALGLKGSQSEKDAAERGISGGGEKGGDNGDGGETNGAEGALAEFQRLVTVAVQKELMCMSDARVSEQPVDVVESIEARDCSVHRTRC